MFQVSTSGSFRKTTAFLQGMMAGSAYASLEHGGQRGVDALSAATPVRSSETANSWNYRVGREKGRYFIEWYNTHIEEGVNIAVIIQYGHATGTGGYVLGINYINPALEGVFNDIAAEVWREVTRG